MTEINKLFAYGTLRQDKEATHKLLGFQLFGFQGNFEFPYITPATDATVLGNVLDVTPTQLKGYDRYEGIERGFYVRTQVAVEDLKTGKVETCWVYEAGNVLDGVETPNPIASGDWFNR